MILIQFNQISILIHLNFIQNVNNDCKSHQNVVNNKIKCYQSSNNLKNEIPMFSTLQFHSKCRKLFQIISKSYK